MNTSTLTSHDTFRDAVTERPGRRARQIGASRSGLMVGEPGDDIKQAGVSMSRMFGMWQLELNRLERDELYSNACEDQSDELDAGEIAAGLDIPVALGSGGLPPAKEKLTTAREATSGRIVIAEDDEATRMLLNRVLTGAGFTVHACENGRVAYDLVRRDGADVVLLDWMMPVMDGPTAVARLRANLDTRGIPVLMLAEQSEIDERVLVLKTCVQDFLTKPFDTRELVARIEQQLRWRRLLAIDVNAAFRSDRLTRDRPGGTRTRRGKPLDPS